MYATNQFRKGLKVEMEGIVHLLLDRRVQAACELTHACETQVVAGFRVLRLGVAEPDDQPFFFFLHAGATKPAASAADLSQEYR